MWHAISNVQVSHRQNSSLTNHRSRIGVGAALAMIMLLSCACSTNSTESSPSTGGDCNATGRQSQVGRATPVAVIVTDGVSPAMDNLIHSIESSEDAETTWNLLAGTREHAEDVSSGDTVAGLVVVAMVDALGNATYPITADLRGVGNNKRRQDISSGQSATCLINALRQLPPAISPTQSPAASSDEAPPAEHSTAGASLAMALGSIADHAGQLTGDNESSVTLLVFGLGRSSIVGRQWTELGLRDDQRNELLAELSNNIAFPDLGSRGVNLRWFGPQEGAPNDVIRTGLIGLASDLCSTMNVSSSCTVVE